MADSSEPPPSAGQGPPPGASGTAPRDAVARLVHDLRNPLNTLSMNLELVGLEIDGRETASEHLRHGLLAMGRAIGELERGLDALEAHALGRRDGGRDGGGPAPSGGG